MGRHSILQYRDIHVGMVSNDSSTFPSPTTAGMPGPIPPFIGEMQSLYINGKYVFEMARAGHLNRMEVSHWQWWTEQYFKPTSFVFQTNFSLFGFCNWPVSYFS